MRFYLAAAFAGFAAFASAAPKSQALVNTRSGPTPAEPQNSPFLVAPGDDVPGLLAEKINEAAPAAEAKATLVQFIDCSSARCVESLRAIQEFIATPLAGEGVRIVAIAEGSTQAEIDAMRARDGITFPVLRDADGQLFKLISSDNGAPRTILYNGAGKVVMTHVGYRPGREALFRYAVETLVAGKEFSEDGLRSGGASKGFSEELHAVDIRGEQAPDVPVETWINERADPKGKFLLVDFWATWCGPCVATMTLAEKEESKYEDKLVTMAISDEDPETVKAFVKARNFHQAIGVDTQRRAIDKLGVTGIPHAIIINPAGKVVWQGHPMMLWVDGQRLLKDVLGGKEFAKGANRD
ncbi:hypothetical protein BH09SUM1_BH09SUM1_15680 [soil metagenome]